MDVWFEGHVDKWKHKTELSCLQPENVLQSLRAKKAELDKLAALVLNAGSPFRAGEFREQLNEVSPAFVELVDMAIDFKASFEEFEQAEVEERRKTKRNIRAERDRLVSKLEGSDQNGAAHALAKCFADLMLASGDDAPLEAQELACDYQDCVSPVPATGYSPPETQKLGHTLRGRDLTQIGHSLKLTGNRNSRFRNPNSESSSNITIQNWGFRISHNIGCPCREFGGSSVGFFRNGLGVTKRGTSDDVGGFRVFDPQAGEGVGGSSEHPVRQLKNTHDSF